MINSVKKMRRWRTTASLYRRVKSLHWARVLNNYGISPKGFAPGSNGELQVPGFPIPLRPGHHDFILEGLSCAQELATAGARFEVNSDGDMLATLHGIRSFVKNKEDLFILGELYVNGAYDLMFPGDPLILDVGMNVGHASLQFAARFPRSTVIGLEPLKPTFDRAVKNFAENGAVQPRIIPHNIGLADQDGSFEVDYADAVPGLTSLYGLPADRRAYLPTRKEKMILRDAATVFEEVMTAHRKKGQSIVMKIDCEGAEYRILQRLSEAGKLRQVSLFMIEWHRFTSEHDPRTLQKLFAEQGFACVLRDLAAPAGMMYASNLHAGVAAERA